MKRLGVVGIVVENRVENAPKVNSVLTEFGDIILGRLGLPNKGQRHKRHCSDSRRYKRRIRCLNWKTW